MLSFKFLWIGLLAPLPWLIKRQARLQVFAEALRLPGFNPTEDSSKANVKHPWQQLWLWAMWLCLLLACARPQWSGEPIELPLQGRDLMLAVDLSGSMAIEDMQLGQKTVNRLDMVKQLLADFIERRTGDRLGLILFGTHAYVQAPLTFDRRTIAQYLHESAIQLVGENTAIGEAIALGVKRFHDKEQSNKVLILISDGRNTASIDPKDAIKLAQHAGVKVYTIGVGADEREQQTLFGTFKVPTNIDIDEDGMTEIATTTGGHYYRARSSQDLNEIYRRIDRLEPIVRDTQVYRPVQELFFWPLAAGLCFSLFMLSNHFKTGWRQLKLITTTAKEKLV
jgi:Ca-activated chloride channel homolog